MTELTSLIRQVNRLQETVDGLVNPEVGRWIDWTPTVDQNGAVAVTVTFARYIAKDDVINMIVMLAVTGTGTAGNAIKIQGIPSAIAPTNINNNSVIGIAVVNETGVTKHVGALKPVGADDFRMGTDGNVPNVGVAPSFALGSGDEISFQAAYER